jgi:hypothetical protein
MARETLEIAMLRVKRRENARRVRCERRFSGVKVRWPVPVKMKVPIDVATVCDVVSSHGRLSWGSVSKYPWLENGCPLDRNLNAARTDDE